MTPASQRRDSQATNRRRRLTSLGSMALALTVAAISIFGIVGPAGAHAGNQSYLYIDVSETSLAGRVETPIRDLNTALGLDLAGSDEEVIAGLEESFPTIQAYLGDHLSIGANGESWPVNFTSVELFFSDLPEEDDNYALFFFAVDADTAIPRQLEVEFDPFFDEIEGRDALLLISNDWEGGVIDNGHEVLTAYDAGNRAQVIDLGDSSWVKTFVASGKLGVNHIKTGPDHILFVLVLLLPSVLLFKNRWEPTATFTSSLWRVLKIVSMFTLAHSITFTLAGLGILPLPPSRVVESIIAISIAAAALHNIKPIVRNKEWLISFAFGLFHGMGFASLVEDLDVSRGIQLLSLLGRNVGIEIGQALVILLLFPALFMLRRTRFYQPFFVGMSLLMALVSIGWMIERVFEIDLAVSGIIDPIVAWPRVLFYIAGFTAICFAARHNEERNDRLRPVYDQPEPARLEPVSSAV